MKEKYIIRDCHPLIFFYGFGAIAMVSGVALGLWLLWHRITVGAVSGASSIFSAFLITTGLQLTLFAMWFDMENNRELSVVARTRQRRDPEADAGPAKNGNRTGEVSRRAA